MQILCCLCRIYAKFMQWMTNLCSLWYLYTMPEMQKNMLNMQKISKKYSKNMVATCKSAKKYASKYASKCATKICKKYAKLCSLCSVYIFQIYANMYRGRFWCRLFRRTDLNSSVCVRISSLRVPSYREKHALNFMMEICELQAWECSLARGLHTPLEKSPAGVWNWPAA